MPETRLGDELVARRAPSRPGYRSRPRRSPARRAPSAPAGTFTNVYRSDGRGNDASKSACDDDDRPEHRVEVELALVEDRLDARGRAASRTASEPQRVADVQRPACRRSCADDRAAAGRASPSAASDPALNRKRVEAVDRRPSTPVTTVVLPSTLRLVRADARRRRRPARDAICSPTAAAACRSRSPTVTT